jgi:hypothetical protein
MLVWGFEKYKQYNMIQLAKSVFQVAWISVICYGCAKKNNAVEPPVDPPSNFSLSTWAADGQAAQPVHQGLSKNPLINLHFGAPVNRASVGGSIAVNEASGAAVAYRTLYSKGDSMVTVQPEQALRALASYNITIAQSLKSAAGGSLNKATTITFNTGIDSTAKFPALSDEALLDLVQKQTFNYFWDFGHPVSGLARERNGSGDLVTSGGSGFGIMTIVTAIHRAFISRAEGLERLQKIVGFLKNNAQTFHGAFPHWLNGATGAVIPFSQKDNGADLVETSYLMQGLLTARQYFNGGDVAETALRNDINDLWNAVEWDWFRKEGENVLYWHWSRDYEWQMNHPIKGWNEALITYVLAASSPNHAIPKEVYDEGWASNGGMKNGAVYFGITLPLGPQQGGPLFFEHYSFLGINPNNLKDAYADYGQQTKAHTLISYNYCVANPKSFYGYSSQNWGLTASDDINGYMAHEPTNDNGVISPTAALSSFPYTPEQSMQALKFFYYTLGDKLWKEYGFVDAFSLHHLWFANSFLAIDQGPIIIMIENHRSGLLWDLFMSCPEVKGGMRKLGFSSPHL